MADATLSTLVRMTSRPLFARLTDDMPCVPLNITCNPLHSHAHTAYRNRSTGGSSIRREARNRTDVLVQSISCHPGIVRACVSSKQSGTLWSRERALPPTQNLPRQVCVLIESLRIGIPW